jgi:cytochrome b
MVSVDSNPWTEARREDESDQVRVWDLFVRISHWVLVGTFVIAYVSEDVLDVHVPIGYLLGATLVLRIVWGFVGSRHARFADFLCTPRKAGHYLRDLLQGRAPRYLGHSPAGAMMIVLLMLGLAGTTVSGLALYAAEENAGPLAGWVASGGPEDAGLPMGHDEEGNAHRDTATAEYWEDVHELSVNLTLLLVLLHVAGVLWASRVHHENLVRAMITGRKRRE